MTFADLEKAFNRALSFCFSWKKLLLTFLVLFLSGIIFVFCNALSQNATPWLRLCLRFLPVFLSSVVLLALGVIVTRIYAFENKRIAVNMRRLLHSSMDLMIGIAYLAMPTLLLFIFLWLVLGVFFLLKEIPGIGDFLSVVFSFGPFLLIFASLLLLVVNLLLLFFVPPAATILSIRKGSVFKKVFILLKSQVLQAAVLFFIGIFPLLIMVLLLASSAIMTNSFFFSSIHSLFIAMEWFFLMIPYALLLSPFIVFFYQFSLESYILLQAKE